MKCIQVRLLVREVTIVLTFRNKIQDQKCAGCVVFTKASGELKFRQIILGKAGLEEFHKDLPKLLKHLTIKYAVMNLPISWSKVGYYLDNNTKLWKNTYFEKKKQK